MNARRDRWQSTRAWGRLTGFSAALATFVFAFAFGSTVWADSIEVELRPLASEPPAAVSLWEVCFRSDVLLHRLTIGVQKPTGYGGTMDWVNCEWDPVTPKLCETGVSPTSVFDEFYTNIDPTRSFAEEVSGGVDTLYVVVAGDLLANDGALTSGTNLPGDWACLARLQFNPGLDLDPEESADLPSLVNVWDPNAYALSYLTDCNEPAVKDGALSACDGGSDGGLASPASLVSVASGIPDDSDGDLRRDFEDNCVYVQNADQMDQGGFQTAVADGVGDMCQCGEGEANGIVDEDGITSDADLTAMLDYLKGSPSPNFEVARCSLQNPSSCTIHDAALLDQAVTGSGPPVNECTAFTN